MALIETLYSWIGRTDITCYRNNNPEEVGPLAQAILSGKYKRIRILSNWPEGEEGQYFSWIMQMMKDRGFKENPFDMALQNVELTSPTDFSSIYNKVSQILKKNREEEKRTYHLSPGTPAMASMWIILSSGEYPASLIETSRESGLKNVRIPFNIKADFISNAFKNLDHLDKEKYFEDIVYRSNEMEIVIKNALKIAGFKVPVLIFGESGTGKELISRGIHKASGRSGSFVAVNCGAIPGELLESEFFGHKKGAFTGADSDHTGFLKQAEGGTIFLDEIGELPLDSQVKLLRALNSGTIRPVGESKEISIDIRVIAATNRDLIQEIKKGRFREDLFHRLAVGIINMPPLSKRGDDLLLLIKEFTKEINNQFRKESYNKWEDKHLSPEAEEFLVQQKWPGNVRELKNTIKRLIIWADTPEISREEAARSMLTGADVDHHEDFSFIPSGFDLNKKVDEYKIHWLKQARKQSGGNMSEAARLLGLENYQTLDNWYRKYGLK